MQPTNPRHCPIWCLLLLLFHGVCTYAQNNIQQEIDSLKTTLVHKTGKDKVFAYKDIGLKFRSIDYDSAWYYTQLGFQEAQKLGDAFLQARMQVSFGILENGKGNSAQALEYYQKAIPAIEASEDHYSIGALYTNISNVHEKTGNVDQSVAYQLKALKEFQLSGDSIWVAGSFNNLGSRYRAVEEWELSLEYFEKALALYKDLGHPYYVALTYNNLASVVQHIGQYDQMMDYAQRSYDGFVGVGATYESAAALYNMGYAQEGNGNLEQAAKYFTQALHIQEDKGDAYVAAHLRNDLAKILLQQGKIGQAQTMASAAYHQAVQKKQILAREALSLTLSNIYAQKGSYGEAYAYLQENTHLKDSLGGVEKAKEVLNLKERYETEQKENQILKQQNELANNALTLKKRNNQLLLLGGSVLLSILVLIVILREHRQKSIRLKQEAELREARAQAAAQEALKEQRLRIARDLHDNVGSQLTYISSIIESTKRAMEKGEAYVTGKLVHMGHFALVTISELRDTIWAMNKDEMSLRDIRERTQELAAMVHEATDDGIRVQVVAATNEEELVLNSFRGMNLFRIIQESVNNAVKHANTPKILIQFKTLGDGVLVSVKDFGSGFDADKANMGNGLRIMKGRAEKSGINFGMESKEGQGTTITLGLAQTQQNPIAS